VLGRPPAVAEPPPAQAPPQYRDLVTAKIKVLECWAGPREQDNRGNTALLIACRDARLPVVRVLLARGANPATAGDQGWTPLISASVQSRVEVVRLLLGHPSGKSTINQLDEIGRTALYVACFSGEGRVARALLESGADPTIARSDGTTPVAIVKKQFTTEGHQDCVAALEVRLPQHPVF
jgi:ankyrin repeat protein